MLGLDLTKEIGKEESPAVPGAGFFISKSTIFVHMALFGIVVQLDKKTLKLLKQINCKLDKILNSEDEEVIKQEIMDKLNSAIADIKSTIKI